MVRSFAWVLGLMCVAGCGLDEPTRTNDPAEIAKAARAAKGTVESEAQHSKVEFLYFTAAWCGPCRQVKPLFQQSKADFPEVQFRELDIDAPENRELASKYKVNAIPHFFVVVDGRTVGSHKGAFATKGQMANFLRTYAKQPAK
jgi:thiol-disulfide isomerase/thioredoxin